MIPELIADYACLTGEGPLWHSDERCLYWVDIPRGRLFRYDPGTGDHAMVLKQDDAIGGFTIQADGALLLCMARGTLATWKNGVLATVLDGIPGEERTRFNDEIADPEGRVFAGTMSGPDGPGKLYRIDPDGTYRVVESGLGTPNGMGFTPDLTGFYFTDTRAGIYLYDYDRESGTISNRRMLVDAGNCAPGRPDGMTVDAEGTLWSAQWDGNCMIQFTADGTELQRVAVPAAKVSCVTFGGDDLTDMYITTAGGDQKDKDGPDAGGLFRLNLGVQGRPEFRSQIGL